ncbi:MAG: hypothetical protein PHC68_13455 [Syntrophorhabdaceae bacterium]|nr:hypothetical protein [Syntrophorhabdaceae bacterium]
MKKSIKGYKAFNKGLICKGFQFEEGKTYKTDKAVICQEGFHFCVNPLDVLDYYDLCDSEFAEVEAIGKTVGHKEDSKHSTTEIKIGARMSFKAFVEASVSFLLSVKKPKSGYYAQLASSGDYAKLASSGDRAQLASSGDNAQLASSGDNAQLELSGQDSVGAGIGFDNRIKGKKGDWITLAEWKYDEDKKRYVPLCVKSAQIDGKKLKEGVWYILKDGEFREVK